jgi:nucleoside 2-deoxyribosyltransferase
MFNAALAKELRSFGHVVFLPQEHEQRKDMPNAIFHSDVDGIDGADAVVACLDGADPDSGTSWEVGYGYACEKVVVCYRTDFRLFEGSDQINLMLTECADAVIIMPLADIGELALAIDGALGGHGRPYNDGTRDGV